MAVDFARLDLKDALDLAILIERVENVAEVGAGHVDVLGGEMVKVLRPSVVGVDNLAGYIA